MQMNCQYYIELESYGKLPRSHTTFDAVSPLDDSTGAGAVHPSIAITSSTRFKSATY